MKIHQLLDHPSKWTQHALAKDAEGNPCMPLESQAASWCLLGAYYQCYGYTGLDQFADAGRRYLIASKSGYEYISNWNNAPGRTVEEVRQFATAIGY